MQSNDIYSYLFIDNALFLHKYAPSMHNYVNNTHKNSANNSATQSASAEGALLNTSNPISVAVVGARGYTGLETVRLLLNHPQVELKACFATKDFKLSQYLSNSKAKNIPCYADTEIFNHPTDVVFLATPAEVSLELAPKLLQQGRHVIDLSGAFRLKKNDYQKWYGFLHTEPALLSQADYGLMPFAKKMTSEKTALNKFQSDKFESDKLPSGKFASEKNLSENNLSELTPVLIANPGCYATSIAVALKPLLDAKIIDPSWVIIDAKSGTTGAGKKAAENLLFSEVDGECLPYKIASHQHTPEILEALSTLFSEKQTEKMLSENLLNLQFCTHLLPTRRGIISSIYAQASNEYKNSNASDNLLMTLIQNAYHESFGNYPLVEFGPTHSNPHLLSLKKVVGTAKIHITFQVQNSKIFIFSCIDNLMKGAASQAIENMNRIYQLPIDTGLNCEALS